NVLGRGRGGAGLLLGALLLLLGELLRLAGVLDDLEGHAAVRRTGPADDARGRGGQRLLDVFALVVVHRADLAPLLAAYDRVADAERPALDDDRRKRTAA